MQTNKLPLYDMSDNPTNCCPRFRPEAWEGVELHLDAKPFARAETRSIMHIPVNFGRVFGRVMAKLEPDFDPHDHIVLSRELSPWKAEHLFAHKTPLEGEEMATLSGTFITKTFEGPFSDAGKWDAEMRGLAKARGCDDPEVYFFHTTCPKCARVYGKSPVVGLARTEAEATKAAA
jgi:hypothetical protein